jgi:dipeptidyl aminopeptidase/acylaminoacyl peptidase
MDRTYRGKNMTTSPIRILLAGCLLALVMAGHAQGQGKPPLKLMDVFELEYADDPQVAPDGKRIVYVRTFMDVQKDRVRSNLWLVNVDGSNHQPLTSGKHRDASPRWSPDGKRIVFISDRGGSPQLHVSWVDTRRTAQITDGTSAPLAPAWSPDGKQIAFVRHVPLKQEPFVKLPPAPEGAEWAAPAKVIREVSYRFDGKGYLKPGYLHLFVVPAEGGTARQLTTGPHNHAGAVWNSEGPSWAPDGKSLLFAANLNEDADFEPRESEIYRVGVDTGKVQRLTKRKGPDAQPVPSPDGKRFAYVGYDDHRLGYQPTHLYLADGKGKKPRLLTGDLDRSVRNPHWNEEGTGVYFLYDDQGQTRVGFVSLEGKIRTLASAVGGTTIGRPYASGSYSVAAGTIAYTHTTPHRPADVAVIDRAGKVRQVTALNEDLLAQRALGAVEELWYPSSHDGKKMQAWLVKPPTFDPGKKYPLILEIHGGPFANYGPRFTMECQLYAAAGYVVLYVNPRGSTSYGQAFANLIHHKYPGNDYDDLMAGVDEVLKRDYIDRDNLFVTGGSGGGILTAWIVGKTSRFRAAVSAKPIINWYSAALTTDIYTMLPLYWFPGTPWTHPEEYLARSPLSLVGNVTTPTMLMTGEADHRTPISESEQFYQALKLRKVDTALVRIPDASHHIVARPSRLLVKVAHVLKWFKMHRKQ